MSKDSAADVALSRNNVAAWCTRLETYVAQADHDAAWALFASRTDSEQRVAVQTIQDQGLTAKTVEFLMRVCEHASPRIAELASYQLVHALDSEDVDWAGIAERLLQLTGTERRLVMCNNIAVACWRCKDWLPVSCYPTIATLLEDEEPYVRVHAVLMLKHAPANQAVPLLLPRLQDDDYEVAHVALVTLGGYSGGWESVLPAPVRVVLGLYAVTDWWPHQDSERFGSNLPYRVVNSVSTYWWNRFRNDELERRCAELPDPQDKLFWGLRLFRDDPRQFYAAWAGLHRWLARHCADLSFLYLTWQILSAAEHVAAVDAAVTLADAMLVQRHRAGATVLMWKAASLADAQAAPRRARSYRKLIALRMRILLASPGANPSVFSALADVLVSREAQDWANTTLRPLPCPHRAPRKQPAAIGPFSHEPSFEELERWCDPDYVEPAPSQLAWNKWMGGQPQEALNILQTVKGPDDTTLWNLAVVAARSGDFDTALQALLKRQSVQPPTSGDALILDPVAEGRDL